MPGNLINRLPALLPALLSGLLTLSPLPALALDHVDLTLTGPDRGDQSELLDRLRAASLLRQAERDKITTGQDLYATALADYRRLVETLYANGYYSGRISIRIDGREAALIPAYAPPDTIRTIQVSVDPGPPFQFGTARIAPLPQGATPPAGFATGKRARATVVINTSEQAISDWRDRGHAKAEIGAETVVADHRAARLDADIGVRPGPRVTFGDLIPQGSSRVRRERILAIAGLPSGETFSPEELDQAANRLRRTGAFQSVALSEQDRLQPGNVMDIEAALVDAPPRRFGVGVEVSNQDGLTLSGFWLHRNLLGGAERFRIEGEIGDIYGSNSGVDYSLGMRFERPATLGPDTLGFLQFDIESIQDPNDDSDSVYLAGGVSRRFSDHLTGEAALALSYSETDGVFGRRDFTIAALPMELEWDRRDDTLNPSQGHYVETHVTPYIGLAGEEAGAQLRFDGRIYRQLGSNDRLVAAARMQLGSVVGSSLQGTAPQYLFYSGGGGTVRGHPYRSLGVPVAGGTAGGRSFVGLSGEVRVKVKGAISVVGFADAGYIGSESFYDGSGLWHSGAGLGLRYDTVVGPIRLDVAAPVTGNTGSGVQVYIGIGQAF